MNPKWIVKEVTPYPDFSLIIVFNDNSTRKYDGKKLFYGEDDPLSNIETFMKAHADYGTVVFTDNIDVSPEHLYEESIPIY